MPASLRLSLTAAGLLAGFSYASAQNFNAAPPNAEGQTPAFKNQIRAPAIKDTGTLEKTVIADGLQSPWGMDQLPDGRWIVTEQAGTMRIVSADGVSEPVTGLPEVDDRGQGGLLDVVVRSDFDETRRIWWSFSEPHGDGRNATSVATGTLSDDETRIENSEVIFQQQPAWRSTKHFGSRLVFGSDGALYITTGERSTPESRPLSQDVSTHIGKVLRINPMGGAADGNPEIEGGAPEIWSYGHRNIQSAALGPDGDLWIVEHGPRGGDELNRPEAGKNYGWPDVTYGVAYSGATIGEGITAREGVEQPVYYWDPVIAPSGMVFYDGEMFPEWQGDALIGALAGQALVRLELEEGRVRGEARYLQGDDRIRDVDVNAEDGAIMVLTDASNGQLIRLTPGE